VGYAHVVAESVGKALSSDVRYSLENRLYVNQGGSRFLQRLAQTSTETSNGRLKGFESVLQVGPAVTRFEGTINAGNLEVETIRGSSRTTRTIPWQSSYRGLVALEQSLRQNPMNQKGQRRALQMLLPGQYELATARLRCRGVASVPLIDGQLAELLEIHCEIEIEGSQPSYSTMWTSDDGRIVRSFSPGLDLVSYRTDEDTATNFASNDSVVASIAVGGGIKQPREAKRVAYRISPTSAAKQSQTPIEIDPAPGQYIRGNSDGVFQVLVSRRTEVVSRGFVGADLPPTDADLEPNHFVDSGATLIRRFADAAVASREMTVREIALELTRVANRTIKDQPEPGGLTKASDVAFDSAGDTTGRAVFLAALLRARKIPSRLAIGVKYLPGHPNRMVYHAWTLAHVDGEWLHLDAGEGSLALADRLIFSTTDLSGGKEYDAMLPFLEAIRRIRIEIVGQS
jgi:transglutaminase-like putative cysteine protease